MRYLCLLIILCACGSDKGNSNFNQTPIESSSLGVVDTPPSGLTSGNVIIPSSKKYGPTLWEDGKFVANRKIFIKLPLQIPVTSGRSGNHYLFITVDNMKCLYKGNGSNTFADYNPNNSLIYNFDFCVSKDLIFTIAQINSFRLSSENLGFNPSSDEIELLRGEKIIVSVNNGNHKKSPSEFNITTSVTVHLSYEV